MTIYISGYGCMCTTTTSTTTMYIYQCVRNDVCMIIGNSSIYYTMTSSIKFLCCLHDKCYLYLNIYTYISIMNEHFTLMVYAIYLTFDQGNLWYWQKIHISMYVELANPSCRNFAICQANCTTNYYLSIWQGYL